MGENVAKAWVENEKETTDSEETETFLPGFHAIVAIVREDALQLPVSDFGTVLIPDLQ